MDVIICLHKNNIDSLPIVITQLYKNMNNIRIIIIGNKELEKIVKHIDCRIQFIDEDLLIENCTLDKIKNILNEKIGDNRRAGWYFQQFLKMGYALKTKSDSYVVFDSDLIILNKRNFKEDDKFIFYKKIEYHKPYFETMNKLLGLNKIFPFSFICEHMIINTMIMRELINEIEQNTHSDYAWWENILNAINKEDLPFAGFSEFETYGTYALSKYKDLFIIKDIRSWRNAGEYLDKDKIDKSLLRYLGNEYDTISLESWSKDKKRCYFMNNKIVQKYINIKILIKFLNIINKILK